MKFSQMPYSRPDLQRLREAAGETLHRLQSAGGAEEQIRAMEDFEQLFSTAQTMGTLASVRHSIDTRDPFYDGENRFFDQASPQLQDMQQQLQLQLLRSPYRPALEKHFGKLYFTNLEIAVRSFRPEMVELMQQENQLMTDYQKLYASALVEFRGQKLTLPQLGPFKQSTDRTLRRAAFETEGRFFDGHREELDQLFDRLIRNRTAQAQMLGHKNYLPLGYDRLSRNCYDSRQVADFREQIARDLVPLAARLKEAQRCRLGVERLCYYDDALLFAGGNARPKGTAEEILQAGRRMYQGLSPETAEFVDFLFDNQLFDVLSREGKAPGGYCTEFYDYKAPFIFSNFNGTAGDVDVLTHEAGHAFASYRAMRKGYPLSLLSPTMEACEVHSMSMEFLTQEYHHLFFGRQTHQYELGHCSDALCFLPYGCMVDEFQTLMYENPDFTPAQRNDIWLRLERKYRPWVDFDGLPFYSRGAGWQRQLHIYLYPLYYIDYCMAQIVAFQFWLQFRRQREETWKKYLAFLDAGGSKTFRQLVQDAQLQLPYEEGCVRRVGREIYTWLQEQSL